MNHLPLLSLGLGIAALIAAGSSMSVFAAAPGAGDVAPDFALAGSDGKTHKLSDYKGKKAVVLAWFPKAFTGG